MDARIERVAEESGANPIEEQTRDGGRGATSAPTCFFELDADLPLARRVIAELLGAFLLMSVVSGSSIASSQLSVAAPVWASIFVGLAISGALLALIFTFGAVSGGHFNPLITVLQWLGGERSARCMLWYVAAQILGALCGAWLTRLIFAAQPVLLKAQADITLSLILSEMVATAGLMIVVFGCARSGRRDMGPIAVAGWLFASIMVTPSGSYVNPAVSLAAIVSTGPVVLSSATAAAYILVEVIGALVALGMISVTHPRR